MGIRSGNLQAGSLRTKLPPSSGRTSTGSQSLWRAVERGHFDPGEAIFVNTGHGEDVFLATVEEGKRPQFHLYWNRDAIVWNNSGDRVFRRHPNGTFTTEPFPIP